MIVVSCSFEYVEVAAAFCHVYHQYDDDGVHHEALYAGLQVGCYVLHASLGIWQ